MNNQSAHAINPLIVFDLDRTLLNKESKLSSFTLQTLQELDKRGIHYTIATGRSFLSAASTIEKHTFPLPQIYTNGVVTWCPTNQTFSFDNCLTLDESYAALDAMKTNEAHPFVNAIDEDGNRFIFHGEYRNQTEQHLLERFKQISGTTLLPLSEIEMGLRITNISMIGPSEHVVGAHENIDKISHLIAYSGQAVERNDYRWIDIHHLQANKGAAVMRLKEQLNIDSVICFGDGDNDLSMFAIANECYAPDNANEENKKIATAVINHHDDDGVAKFLVERFSL